MTKVIICGVLGNMGAKILDICFDDHDIEVVAGIDQQDGVLANVPIFRSFSDCDIKADVVIDFSNPVLTDSIVEYCRAQNTALVMCTTGQNESELDAIRRLADSVPVFLSANMSVGIALLKSLAARAAAMLRDNFDIEIVEYHHHRKLDAPSGTAMMLANEINASTGNKYTYVYDRHDVRKSRDKNEIGMHAIRGGTIVGAHEVIFAGNDEVITLSHQASSRTVFAVGAVNAAKFVAKQKPGIYDMDSIMAGTI